MESGVLVLVMEIQVWSQWLNTESRGLLHKRGYTVVVKQIRTRNRQRRSLLPCGDEVLRYIYLLYFVVVFQLQCSRKKKLGSSASFPPSPPFPPMSRRSRGQKKKFGYGDSCKSTAGISLLEMGSDLGQLRKASRHRLDGEMLQYLWFQPSSQP